MIPARLYLYAGIVLALTWLVFTLHDRVWQRGYDVAHAEVTRTLNDERAAVQAEREAFERKAREAEKEHLAKREAVIEQWHKDKADAKQDSDRIIADLRAGNRQLRTYWEASAATCALVSGVSAAASEPDGANRLREDSLGRVLHAIGTCQAQRDGLIGVIESWQP